MQYRHRTTTATISRELHLLTWARSEDNVSEALVEGEEAAQQDLRQAAAAAVVSRIFPAIIRKHIDWARLRLPQSSAAYSLL